MVTGAGVIWGLGWAGILGFFLSPCSVLSLSVWGMISLAELFYMVAHTVKNANMKAASSSSDLDLEFMQCFSVEFID